MTQNKATFSSEEEFIQHINSKKKGELVVGYFDCNSYKGIALVIMIVFDTKKSTFDLDLQWMSLGLDLYGDTLQESYVYQFKTIQSLLKYLDSKYQIKTTDIPYEFKFNNDQFPNPISDTASKPVFEVAWREFQSDFKSGAFLDLSQKLVYNSLNEL